MRNRIRHISGILFIVLAGNAYSHTGTHTDGWLKTVLHFMSSPDHFPFIVIVIVILGLVIRHVVSGQKQ